MFKRALGLGVAIVIGALLVSASGAATTRAQTTTKLDVSTRASVIHYLRSIHVNAKHAVIQRGLHNYAGSKCPDKGWTCASTKHTVVQIAKQGGQNRYACKSSKCAVVQISGAAHGVYAAGRQTASASAPTKPTNNSAVCVKTGSGSVNGGGQTCTISQTGSGTNTAGIYENSMKVSGVLQSQKYTATITQTSSGTGTAGTNTACVTQNVNQDGSTSNTNGKATSVSLQAIQSILITQNTLAGNNSAQYAATSTGACDTTNPLTQTQTQSSTVSATGNITQILNPQVDGLTGGNVSLDIEQNQSTGVSGVKGSASGLNNAVFSQATNQTLIANAKNGKTVNQTENTPDGNGTTGSPFSGIVGTLNQDSSGLSTATVTQRETQCEDAANTSNSPALTQCSTTADASPPSGITLSQTENGPVGLLTPKSAGRVPYYHKGTGTSAQTGAGAGVFDTFGLTQKSFQYTDPSGPGITISQANTMQGDCASSGDGSSSGGTCQAGQTATLNGQDTSDGYSAGSIGNLTITCTNGHSTCKATPPPDPTFVSGPSDPNYSSSAAFTFTDPATGGVHFLCKVDGGTTQEVVTDPCSSGVPFSQGYGAHTFKVAASDSNGNVSHYVPSTAFSWTNVPPAPVIDTGPTNGSSTEAKSADFTFHDADTSLSFLCSQTGTAGSYSACSPTAGPNSTGTGEEDYAGPLALGTQNFYVRVTDGSGHESSPVSVQWTILPTCDASSDTNALFNAMPTDVTYCLNPSTGFEATSTSEMGDEVGIAGGAGSKLGSLKVDFQSYACQSGYWNGVNPSQLPDPCSSTANATFQWPITANIYSVGSNDTVGALLATTTPTQTIPYRPSADTTGHCTGTVANKWWNPNALGGGACQNSIGTVLTFNNWTYENGFDGTLPANVIWTVAFNTSDYGSSPAGHNPGCYTADGGCPYDALNVGDNTLQGAPYAGTDTDPDGAFLSSTWTGAYCDNGVAGTGSLRLDTPCWTGQAPLGEILPSTS